MKTEEGLIVFISKKSKHPVFETEHLLVNRDVFTRNALPIIGVSIVDSVPGSD